MAQIKFGTDGWRAVIAEDFTFANVARVAQATADYWAAHPVAGTGKKVIVGYDRRFFSDQFAQCSAEVFAGNGFQVVLTPEPVPTPSVSFAVKDQRAVGGVMITASHNPPAFDGFKLKSHYGGSSDSDTCQAVESCLDRNPVRSASSSETTCCPLPPHPAPSPTGGENSPKQISRIEPLNLVRTRSTASPSFRPEVWDAGGTRPYQMQREVHGEGGVPPGEGSGTIIIQDVRPAHFAALRKLVDFKLIAKSKLRFAHDALFGVGAGCFEQLLAGTSCKVTTLNGNHDVLFGGINPEPVEANYARSQAFLRRHPHDLCLVTDGDADRVGGMDGRGHYLTTHNLICLLLHHLISNRKGRGRVVKALTTTSLVDKMCAAHGLELVETGVGFKYICAEMLKGDVLLGAEESGGIGFAGHIPERDGIAAGLMLLEMLATERVSVNQLVANLEKEFGPHRYGRIDTHFPLAQRAALMDYLKRNPPAKLLRSPLAEVKSYDGVKFIAQDSSWLMLRGSGTEPMLRIYAEGKTDSDAQKLLRTGVKLIRRVCPAVRLPRRR
ncbi:MAG: phosphoglucomutase/phosphomannomutase family protein [Verrucomicrobia bacterium]|nr:phosphoglucomutase/phosphomannomutase family protein [Verrucomicrobiota bacterium]